MGERTVLMTGRLYAALEKLWQTIEDEGPRPDDHRLVMRRLRNAWPALWETIDEVQDAYEEQRILNGNPNAPEVAGLIVTSPLE